MGQTHTEELLRMITPTPAPPPPPSPSSTSCPSRGISRRRGEVLLSPLAPASAAVELAEAEVAVGLQGAHAELGRQRQRLAKGVSRSLGPPGGLSRGDFGEETGRPCLIGSLLILRGEIQSLLGDRSGVPDSSSQDVALAEPGKLERVAAKPSPRRRVLSRRLYKWERPLRTARKGIRDSQR